MDKQYLSTEFDSFFEFPSDDKSQVSSISAKLFAEHIAYPIKAEVERLRDEIAALRQNNRELLDQRFDLMAVAAQQSAALKLAKDAFSAINIEAKTFMSYENARNNFSDDTDERKAYERAMVKASELTKQALAAIDEVLKGE